MRLFIIASTITLMGGTPHCTFWAQEGECDTNPNYMYVYCKPACEKAGFIQKSYSDRCNRSNHTAAFGPQQIQSLFLNIAKEYPQYGPELVSVNDDNSMMSFSTQKDKIKPMKKRPSA